MRFRTMAMIAIATTMAPPNSTAQTLELTRSTTRRVDAMAVATSQTPSSGGSFVVESLGGSIGSLAGIGVVVLTRCVGDALGCAIVKVGAGGIAGAVGATLGTTVAARYTHSRRSVLGAALGAIVGTGAGLGVFYVLDRNTNRNIGDPPTIPIFVISQGTFAAIGSRLLGR